MSQLTNDIWATFTALTRIPFWRIKEVPKEHFKHVVDHWSLLGWLTGGIMAGVLWLSGQVFPLTVAVVIAFIARLLITGAIHEDGLMDLCDGLGGGTTRERVLAIMKDSHTGAYATIGFVSYVVLWVSLLSGMTLEVAVTVVFIADPLSKFMASHLPMLLPYARKEEDSKMQVEYRRYPPLYKWLLSALFGLLPIILMPKEGLGILLMSTIMLFVIYGLLKKRIAGYTGDCMGATFLLCEVFGYFGVYLMCVI